MAKLDTDIILTDEQLGLEPANGADSAPAAAVKSAKTAKATNSSVAKADKAMKEAAATAAIKAAVEANNEIAIREAEKTYIVEKKKFMLTKCKEDDVVEFVGQKIFANYFGPVYTFLYNTIPVTVKFDGSTQKFPRFIYDFIVNKINEVSNSNMNKVDIETR